MDNKKNQTAETSENQIQEEQIKALYPSKWKTIAGVTAATLFCALVAGLGVGSVFYKDTKKTSEASASLPAEKSFTDPFAFVKIEARSAVVWDIKNQKALYSKNSLEPLPLASLTKIMTAITAVDLVPHSTVVTINKAALASEGDTGLFADEKWKLSDLIDFSLIVSSNDGASAIAAVVGAVSSGWEDPEIGRAEFIKKMDEKTKEVGLESTFFSNENGLDTDKDHSGGVGSALDMAHLFEYTLNHYPDILEVTRYEKREISSLSDISHEAENTNTIIADIPGLIASKTGYTELSGGNLIIAFDPALGRPIIVSVLGSSYEGRFSDTLALVNAATSYISQGR